MSKKYYKKIKNRWISPKGKHVSGGGILVVNKIEGYFWFIGEKKYNKKDDDKITTIYTDIGGKYRWDDGDIYACIAREWNEETYHSSELTRSNIIELWKNEKKIYVNSKNSKNKSSSYICLIIDEINLNKYTKIDSILFDINRSNIIKNNPSAPFYIFKSLCIKKVYFNDINTKKISGRLKIILEKYKK